MRQALLPLQAEFGFDLEVLNVAADSRLENNYGEWVPVLMAVDGQMEVELCHFHIDMTILRKFLEQGLGAVHE